MIKELENKIKELSEEIELRDTDEWMENNIDAEYSWTFCGQRQEYKGRLDGLKQALDLINNKENITTKE